MKTLVMTDFRVEKAKAKVKFYVEKQKIECFSSTNNNAQEHCRQVKTHINHWNISSKPLIVICTIGGTDDDMFFKKRF